MSIKFIFFGGTEHLCDMNLIEQIRKFGDIIKTEMNPDLAAITIQSQQFADCLSCFLHNPQIKQINYWK